MSHARRALLTSSLALVALSAFSPHWDPGHGLLEPYPAHMDEYVHWAYGEAVASQGTVLFDNPLTGESHGGFNVASDLHERGFHAYFAVLQRATGIGWLPLVAYTPTILTLLLALAAYVLAEKWGAGVETVVLLAAFPTTLRFLGPGLFVPSTVGLLLFAVGSLCLVGRAQPRLFAFGIISAALWPIHVVAALALFVFAFLYAMFRTLAAPRAAAAILGVAIVPFALAWPYYARLSETTDALADLPPSLDITRRVVPLILFASVGAAWLVSRGRSTGAMASAMGSMLLGIGTLIAVRAESGHDFLRLYDRSHLFLFFIAIVLGGAGVKAMVETAPRVARIRSRAVHAPLAVAMALFLALPSFSAQAEARFPEVLSEFEYEAFLAARERLRPGEGRALVDGADSMPYSILTGQPTLHTQFPGSSGLPPEIEMFFQSGATDTYLLVTANVTVVVTPRVVENPDLIPIAPRVYALDSALLARLRGNGLS